MSPLTSWLAILTVIPGTVYITRVLFARADAWLDEVSTDRFIESCQLSEGSTNIRVTNVQGEGHA